MQVSIRDRIEQQFVIVNK